MIRVTNECAEYAFDDPSDKDRKISQEEYDDF